MHFEAEPRRSFGQFQGDYRDPDRPPFGKLDGVADQVDEDLFDAEIVTKETAGHPGRSFDPQFEPLAASSRSQQAFQLLQELRQREGAPLDLELAGLDLGNVEDVVDDAEEDAAGSANLLRHDLLVGGERLLLQQLRQPQDAVQGSPDLVAHVGQERALGLRGGLGGLAGLFKLILVAFAFGNVPGDGAGSFFPLITDVVKTHFNGEGPPVFGPMFGVETEGTPLPSL